MPSPLSATPQVKVDNKKAAQRKSLRGLELRQNVLRIVFFQ